MPRFFVKIPVLLLNETSEFVLAVDETWQELAVVDEDYTHMPGVSVKSGEITLERDTTINYEFWIVKRVQDIDVEEVLQGSDAIVLWVDSSAGGAAALAGEYLSIIETRLHRIPSMIVNLHAGSPVTCHDMDFLRETWASHVVECCSVNRSYPGRFRHVIEVLARCIAFHKDAGPVDMDTGWIRESVAWQSMQRCILKETVSTTDKSYLGRNFLVLSLLRARHSSLESHVLGSIATRWLEMAGDYMLAARVSEQLGDVTRTRLLKRKHLHGLITAAGAEFKRLQFKNAAMKYEEAAFWNRIEFVDPAQEDDMFLMALDAWMSAFEFSKAPDLLAQVKSPATALSRLKDKAFRGLEYLIQHGLLEKANDQFTTLVTLYLRHDLRETANELAARHASVKLSLLASKLGHKFMGDALLLIEEIGNLNDQFALGVTIPPELIVTACMYLVHEGSFAEFEKLLPLVNDPLKQKELLARRVVREHEMQEEEKQAREDREKDTFRRLLAYKQEEQEDALRYAKARRDILFDLIEQGKPDRAMHFAGVNALWLKDLDQDQIASDLVVQSVKHAVKHDHLLEVRSLQDLITPEGMQDIVRAIVDRCAEITSKGNVSGGPAILHHFQRTLRAIHRYQEADGITPLLVTVLVNEAITRASDPDEITDAIIEVYEKIAALQRGSTKTIVEPSKLDTILEGIVERYINDENVNAAEAYLHKIGSLDAKKRLQQAIDGRIEKREADIGERHKRKEAARILKERIQETTRSLFLEQGTLGDRRANRARALSVIQDAGDIPASSACFLQDPAVLDKDAGGIASRQARVLASFESRGNPAEIALATLVSVMLAVKANELDAARATLGRPATLDPYLRNEIRGQPAFAIAADLVEAIDLGSGAEIESALKASELLPLVHGERFLPYAILGRPVPASVRAGEKHVPVEPNVAFKETTREVFPYLLDIVSVALEPVREGLVVRRGMLGRQGKLPGMTALREGSLEKAVLQYQGEAYTLFEEGDAHLGWTSMFMAVLAMVRQGTDGRQAAALFKSVIASVPSKEGTKDLSGHPMYSLLSLYLKCVEHGLDEEAAMIGKAMDVLPLIDVEQDAVTTWLRR